MTIDKHMTIDKSTQRWIDNDAKTPVIICILISLAFLVLYLTINHWPMERMVLPLTEAEEAIPYLDWSYLIYMSAFLQAVLVIRLIPRKVLPMYIAGPAIAMVVGAVFFILYPVEYPRYLFPDDNYWISFFRLIDAPGNCFPSLHVTMTILFAHIYNLILQYRGDAMSRRGAIVKSSLMWLWTMAIVISVLTTKQHYLWDVIGGMSLSVFTILILNTYFHRVRL